MRPLDVAGFNRFQDEILVIDANLNGLIDPEDPAIAVRLTGYARGERIPFMESRYEQLRELYARSMK
ncbi:MAG TPA: hypothetical protein VFW62_07305 [bacterium]|nr:hypothetical protein [bacterium]